MLACLCSAFIAILIYLLKTYSIKTNCFLELTYVFMRMGSGIGARIGHDMDWFLSTFFLVVAVSSEIIFEIVLLHYKSTQSFSFHLKLFIKGGCEYFN